MNLVDVPGPGQANTVIMVDLTQKVDDLARSVCHVTMRMLAKKVDIRVGIV